MATTDLAQDFFYDNVPIECPACESTSVTVYRILGESEAHCDNCRARWLLA